LHEYKSNKVLKTIRSIIKNLLPPIILNAKRRFHENNIWRGNHKSWEDAIANASGYDDAAVINKVVNSMDKVLADSTLFERDGEMLTEPQYSFEFLAWLMWIASNNKGDLNLIDFGGGLASTYYQYKLFLQHLPELKWNVVEKEAFVKIAKKMNFDSNIEFYLSIEDSLKFNKSNTILLGSVLPYIENPYQLISYIIKKDFEYIIIDRTWMLIEGEDQLTIQENKSGNTNYPCWFFNSKKFENIFKEKYSLVFKYNNNSSSLIKIDGKSRAVSSGFILKKIV
jgi:putative methyltransferase (TIGR04325 family)